MLPIVDIKTMQESDRATIASGTPSREVMLRKYPRIADASFAFIITARSDKPGGVFYLRNSHAAMAATVPSAMAVVSWRMVFWRQSPATNRPGVLVMQASEAIT